MKIVTTIVPFFAWASLGLAVGCGGVQDVSESDELDVRPGVERGPGTEVAILGTLHRGHETSTHYGLAEVEAVIRAANPDVVMLEVPPHLFPSVVEACTGGPVTPEAAVFATSYPEVCEVAIPLQASMGYTMLPISGWTESVSEDREAYYATHPIGPGTREYILAQHRSQAAQLDNDMWENPAWVNGEEYLALSSDEGRWLSYFAEEDLGDAGELRLNSRHAGLMLDGIREHVGERILVMFGARHRYFLLGAAEASNLATIVDVNRFVGW